MSLPSVGADDKHILGDRGCLLGLNPDKDHILQIACVVTSGKLDEIVEVRATAGFLQRTLTAIPSLYMQAEEVNFRNSDWGRLHRRCVSL